MMSSLVTPYSVYCLRLLGSHAALLAVVSTGCWQSASLFAEWTFAHPSCLRVSGGSFGRPGGQRQRGAIGVAFAAGGHSGVREDAVATIVDLNSAAAVRVQTVQLRNHSRAALRRATVDVGDGISAHVPGACDGFRGYGAVRVFHSAAPQIRGDRGVLGPATIEIVAFLEQSQIVDSFAVVDATDCFCFHSGAIAFAEIERVRSIEHGADVVGFAVLLAFVRLTFDHDGHEPNASDNG